MLSFRGEERGMAPLRDVNDHLVLQRLKRSAIDASVGASREHISATVHSSVLSLLEIHLSIVNPFGGDLQSITTFPV
jgi:hypothetical protein